jgi:hypothetical protein
VTCFGQLIGDHCAGEAGAYDCDIFHVFSKKPRRPSNHTSHLNQSRVMVHFMFEDLPHKTTTKLARRSTFVQKK